MLNKQIDSVQILRAIAAIFVMLFHYYGSYLASVGHPEHVNYFIFGATGVDLFFIISGFIMFLTIDKMSDKSVINFFMNRLIRVWPLYFVATIVTVGPALYTMDGLKSILFYPFMVPSYPVLSQGWTLAYEVYFYLLVSLLLMVSQKRGVFLGGYYLLTLIVLPLLLHLKGNFFDGYITSNNWLHLLVSNKNIYFFIGWIIGCLYKHVNIIKILSIIIFLISLACILYINYSVMLLNGNVFSQPILLFSLSMFFIGSIFLFKNYSFNKLSLFLGNSSYSIYLWQYFSIGQAIRIVGVFNVYAFILGIILNLIVSYLSFVYIENKLTKFLRKNMNYVLSRINRGALV